MGKIRDWINRDDGDYFQAGNSCLNWYEVVGTLLTVLALLLWHINEKGIFAIHQLITAAIFVVGVLLSWIGTNKKHKQDQEKSVQE